jgi:hypothetical protein
MAPRNRDKAAMLAPVHGSRRDVSVYPPVKVQYRHRPGVEAMPVAYSVVSQGMQRRGEATAALL